MGQLVVSVSEADHIQGFSTAPITLVEYGDFQCPYCGLAYPVIKRVQKKLGAQLQFVFRHFPISSLHQFAELAAEAAEASGAQGKFWEMHDGLYEHQKSLSREMIFSLGRELDLDLNRFKVDLNSRAYFARVKSDFIGGVKSGVNGTPSLYLNGEKYEGPVEVDELLSTISEMLETQGFEKRSVS